MSTDGECSDVEQHDADDVATNGATSDTRYDLLTELEIHEQVIASRPDTPEARHAHTRIRSIMDLGVHLADGSRLPMSAVLAHQWHWPHIDPRAEDVPAPEASATTLPGPRAGTGAGAATEYGTDTGTGDH